MGKKAGGLYINPKKFGTLSKPCMKEMISFLNCLSLNKNNDNKCVRQKDLLSACMDAQVCNSGFRLLVTSIMAPIRNSSITLHHHSHLDPQLWSTYPHPFFMCFEERGKKKSLYLALPCYIEYFSLCYLFIMTYKNILFTYLQSNRNRKPWGSINYHLQRLNRGRK